MAHFLGKVHGKGKSPASQTGNKNGGINSKILSWEGGVEVDMWYNEEHNEDWCTVSLIKHQGSGISRTLYNGPVSGAKFNE